MGRSQLPQIGNSQPTRSNRRHLAARELKEFGFATTLEWDGSTDFLIAAPASNLVALEDGDDRNGVKQAMLTSLNLGEAAQHRERYIADLAAFAEQHAAPLTRERGIAGTLAAIGKLDSFSKGA